MSDVRRHEDGTPADAPVPSLAELTEELAPQVEAVSGAEILVGIPCYDSERTVANVARAVEAGLRKYFPDLASAIVVSDSNSSDETIATALAATIEGEEELLVVDPRSPHPRRVAVPSRGIHGKGTALRSLFAVARAVGAKACGTFDADLRSITPAWVETVLRPVLEHDVDHVTPRYVRHKHDGTITNSIAYPLTAALYGERVRQPIGGDFGFSGRLASQWTQDEEVWTTDVARFGVDIWMTSSALVGGSRIAQAHLGAKVHDAKDPAKHLGPMFRQVVGSLFSLAGRYADAWSGVTAIEDVPSYGFAAETGTEEVRADVPGLLAKFAAGATQHAGTWEGVLGDETLAGVLQAATAANRGDVSSFDLPLDLWIDVVFDFLATYARASDPNALLDAMIPLYFARTASFVREAAEDDPGAAERRVIAYADRFLERKPDLLARWNAS